METLFKINQAARIASVSVRTLHHYDAIGLLTPSNRSTAGYRMYTEADLLRLQQILIGRALGLALEDIRQLLDDPKLDKRDLLLRQRAELVDRVRGTHAMIRAIDAALQLTTNPIGSPAVNMDQLFEGFESGQFDQEAKLRWGQSDAYEQSARRTRKYTEGDWRQYKTENVGILQDAATALANGIQPTDTAALEIAERHRLSIDRWFYLCSKEMHSSLADLYESDERFAKNIDCFGAGVTTFLSAAIRANERSGVRE